MRFENILRIIDEEFDPLKECLHSAFYYGSIARGDYKYGSDVDLLLILDYNFNCPRKAYEKLACWYTSVRERLEIEEGVKWGIQTAVNPTIYDLGSIKCGYGGMIESFCDHLKASAKPLWSREEIDIKDILRKRFPQTEKDYQLTYRLWKTRVIATYLDYYLKNNKYQFMISIKEGMNGIKHFMRHAVLIERRKLKSDYTASILNEFIEIFPRLKEKVLNTYQFFDLWPKLVEEKNYDEMLNFYFNALEIEEKVVKIMAKKRTKAEK